MAERAFDVIVRNALDVEKAFTTVALEVDPVLSRAIRGLAEPVKIEAMSAARSWAQGGSGQARTAAGFRIRRRGITVRVEQGLSKTTGFHPNYGGIQMRHFLLPALEQHETQIEAGVTAVVGTLIARKT